MGGQHLTARMEKHPMHDERAWLTDLSTSVPTDAQLLARHDSCVGEEGRGLRQLIQDNLTLRWGAHILL